MMEIIRLEKVTKRYGGRVVLDHIDKRFRSGDSVAFTGHNGCGKSTLLKIIAGLTTPSEGKVIQARPLLFHYIPEKFPPTALTARQYLMRMSAMDGVRKGEAGRQIETFGEDFFLGELLDVPMKSLSRGTLQKVGVMQALMVRPDVLLLDEPVSGQDKASQKVFIEKVNKLRSEDVTIFMACHENNMIKAIAGDTYVIQDGRLEISAVYDVKRYTAILENAAGCEATDSMDRYGRYYRLRAEEKECDRLLPELLSLGWKLRGMYDEEDN